MLARTGDSTESPTGKESTSKLTFVVIGGIQLHEDLSSSLAIGQRSPLISLSCGSLQHGSLCHQSIKRERLLARISPNLL